MKEVIIAAAIVAVPVALRQFIKSYKARKSVAQSVLDAGTAKWDCTNSDHDIKPIGG